MRPQEEAWQQKRRWRHSGSWFDDRCPLEPCLSVGAHSLRQHGLPIMERSAASDPSSFASSSPSFPCAFPSLLRPTTFGPRLPILTAPSSRVRNRYAVRVSQPDGWVNGNRQPRSIRRRRQQVASHRVITYHAKRWVERWVEGPDCPGALAEQGPMAERVGFEPTV